MGSTPEVSVVSDKSTAGWTWSSRAATLLAPALGTPPDWGSAVERIIEMVRSAASVPPPVRPAPAKTLREVGT